MKIPIMKSYVKETIARLKGKSDEAKAEKNYRQAHAQVTGQLAALNLQMLKNEQLVEDAEEALNDATYPEIVDDQYLTRLRIAQNRYDDALESLNDTKHSIEYFTKLLEKYSAEAAD